MATTATDTTTMTTAEQLLLQHRRGIITTTELVDMSNAAHLYVMATRVEALARQAEAEYPTPSMLDGSFTRRAALRAQHSWVARRLP